MTPQSDSQELLERHWMLDTSAARAIAERLTDGQHETLELSVACISSEAIVARDRNREEIGNIFTGVSDKKLIVIGPCSLDTNVDYSVLFDYISELQERHPGALIAFRGNGAKPRSGKGWTGLFYGNTEERARLFEIYGEAVERDIPILTEVTEAEQLGALAPYLSGVWVGARDVESTALRGKFSAYHLPVGIKNGRTGNVEIVEKAVETVRANSSDNDNSKVFLGQLAMRPDSPGIATMPVPVTEGNKHVAIIARGYELPEDMKKSKKREAAIQHLSALCLLGANVGCAVLIDGTHSVPPMFDIDKKEEKRFLKVLSIFRKAIKKNEIDRPEQIKGVIGEVGPETGRTDPNLILDAPNRKELSNLIGKLVDLLT